MKKLSQLFLVLFTISTSVFAQNPERLDTIFYAGQVTIMEGDMYYVTSFPGTVTLKKIDPTASTVVVIPTGTMSEFKDLTTVGDRLYFRTKSSSCGASHLAYYSEATGVVVPTTIEHPDGIPCAHFFPEGAGIWLYGRFPCTFVGEQYGTLWSFSGSSLTTLREGNMFEASPWPLFDITEGIDFTEYAGHHYYASVNEIRRFDEVGYEEDTILTVGSYESSAIQHLRVHDGKLFFSVKMPTGNRDLYSYNGTVLSLEKGYSTSVAGISQYPGMKVVDGDLYFNAEEVSGEEKLYKHDGTTISAVVDHSSSLPELYDGDLYLTKPILDGELARMVSGESRYVVRNTGPGNVNPKEMTVLDGALYYYSLYNELGASTSYKTGMYKYQSGLVTDSTSITFVGPCDASIPDSNTVTLDLTSIYHGASGGGTFDVTATSLFYSDTVKVTVPEASSPQVIPITLPTKYGPTFHEWVIEAPVYSNPSDPYGRDARVPAVTSPSFEPCLPCSASLSFDPPVCTSEGIYSQTVTIDWDSLYTPEPGYSVTINGVTFSHPFNGTATWTFDDLVADGGIEVFTGSIGAISSEPCVVVDSILKPDCSCKMTYERVGFFDCFPGSGTFDQEILLSFEFPPSTGMIDFGEFVGPIGSSPMTVIFDDLPADGSFQGADISFTDNPACGVLAEWLAPFPDCSIMELPLCHPVSDEDLGAPMDLTKSFNPVPFPAGVQDRVQVKWFKESPSIAYAADEDVACDIEAWPVKDLLTGLPITDGDTIVIENVEKPGKELFKWPIKFRADGAGNSKRVDPSTRYKWRVRCACAFTPSEESAWSVIKIFNTPAFDPSTGIYTPPPGIIMEENGDLKRIGGTESWDFSLFPNPSSSTLFIDLDRIQEDVVFYQIMDMTGRVIKSSQIALSNKQTLMELNLSDLRSGTYLIQLFSNTGSEVRQFVKQ